MKYIKLYENFLDDAIKIEDELEYLTDKIVDVRTARSELKDSYVKTIKDVFDIYSEHKKTGEFTHKKYIKINYVNKTFNLRIDELSIPNDKKEIRIVYGMTIEYLSNECSIKMLSAIMDCLREKFPEYFEGQSMGFFDLKTKEKE